MKTVIFYSSIYNGNTLKIAESMAATLSADLIAIETKISDFDLSQYDLIGFGSAIHFGQHAIRLQRFVSALPLQGKNIFIFSTRCRPFLGNYHRTLKNIIKQKKANLIDEFSCVGFDRTGPWVLINGYNKNRPNTNDLFKARLFAEKLQCKLHPLSSVITSSTATESKHQLLHTMQQMHQCLPHECFSKERCHTAHIWRKLHSMPIMCQKLPHKFFIYQRIIYKRIAYRLTRNIQYRITG